jgi:hypothetical protein
MSFWNNFTTELNRYPTEQEMIDNLIIDKIDENLGVR